MYDGRKKSRVSSRGHNLTIGVDFGRIIYCFKTFDKMK